jgi:hypothetical protein
MYLHCPNNEASQCRPHSELGVVEVVGAAKVPAAPSGAVRGLSLINAQRPGTASLLLLVAGGGHVAGSALVEGLALTVGEAVTAIALDAELEASLGEALGGASGRAHLDGHRRRREIVASKGA